MAIINLRDFYPWYTCDEFIEVSEEIAAELLTDKRYQKTHERTLRRNKVHSLDAEDSIEAEAIIRINSTEEVFEVTERHCDLCRALNDLPEKQGKRIEARFIFGVSQKEIADAEGISEEAVSKSIGKGLAAMKNYLKKFDQGG